MERDSGPHRLRSTAIQVGIDDLVQQQPNYRRQWYGHDRTDHPEIEAVQRHCTVRRGARRTHNRRRVRGCVIALLPEDQIDTCASAVRKAFRDCGFAEPTYYPSTPSAGAPRLP